ncbi:MAG: type II toxin-antitoxin system VapC family toxin [Methanobrevibacter sp.]|nr:type II toxin-antitoxin system VapC family toxin [Methanobrevibacter sp.]
MIFLDTSFIIALVNNSDGRHYEATELAKIIENEEKVISHVIIIEVLNSLRKFKKGKLNQEVYRIIKDNFKIYEESINLYDDALNIQLKYHGELGFADCIIIETMKRLNINRIASFDQHFDGKEGINRIFQ